MPGQPQNTCTECKEGDAYDFVIGVLTGAVDDTVRFVVSIAFHSVPGPQPDARVLESYVDSKLVFGRPNSNLGEFGYDLGPITTILGTGGAGIVRGAVARAPIVLESTIMEVPARRAVARLSGEISRTFAGGKYGMRVLQQDSVAYRYSGGISPPVGRFLTTRQTVGQIASPGAAQRVLNLPPGATAEQLNTFVIPRGTTIYYGRIAGRGDQATQIFIEDASVLRPFP
jgi:hypothetical protein